MNFKVGKFAFFHVHDQGIAENGTSWLLTSMLKGLQCIIGQFRTGVTIFKFSREGERVVYFSVP